MCGCFFLIIFVPIVGDCLGSKSRLTPPPPHPPHTVSSVCEHLWRFILILMYLFCQAIQMPFYKFTKQQPQFFYITSGPKNCIKQKKPASKWHPIALHERWVCFFVQTTVLFWNPSYYYGDIVKENDHHYYLNAKNKYLGVTGVTIKLHKNELRAQ